MIFKVAMSGILCESGLIMSINFLTGPFLKMYMDNRVWEEVEAYVQCVTTILLCKP